MYREDEYTGTQNLAYAASQAPLPLAGRVLLFAVVCLHPLETHVARLAHSHNSGLKFQLQVDVEPNNHPHLAGNLDHKHWDRLRILK